MIHQDISPDSIKAQLMAKMPENLKNAFERMIIAGMKLFYSKEVQQDINTPSDHGQPLEVQIGMSAVGIMGMLMKKSNDTAPPQVLIPAGIYLIVEAADFMDKSGKFEINDKVIGDAIEIFIVGLLKQNGIDENSAQKLAQQMSSQVESGQAVTPQATPQAGLLNQGAQ